MMKMAVTVLKQVVLMTSILVVTVLVFLVHGNVMAGMTARMLAMKPTVVEMLSLYGQLL